MRPRLPALLLALALAVAGASVLAPAHARQGSVASVTLEGRGYGHGHGMSQYGAQGAAQQGMDYRRIIDFYYPGTSWGRAGGNVSVHISADVSTDVVVANRSALTAKSLATGRTWKLKRTGATRWRLTPLDRGRNTRLSVAVGGRWRTVRTLRGQAQFGAGGAPMRLYYPGGSNTYRGTLRSAGGAHRVTVNVVSLETYLRGVVPREMPALWEPAAVRSQAVAARTYAAYERREPMSSAYQICDTSQCQVYGGASAEYPASDAAVRATAGKIVTYGDKPAFTQFSASDGGYTVADSRFPYLTAHPDSYDSYTWTTEVSGATLQAGIERLSHGKLDIGNLVRLDTIRRDGRGAWGGRVTSLRVVGTTGSMTISGSDLQSIAGLRSTLFHVL